MVRSCHRTTTQRFHDYGDDEEDHQTRQEEQGQRRIFPVFEPPIDNVGLDVTCNPSQADGLAVENGCEDDDCADPVWADGCEACMCFNNGNAAWCDGFRGDYYDNYFNDNKKNPWGDTNVRNRKCNPIFRPYGSGCLDVNWQCAAGLKCNQFRTCR